MKTLAACFVLLLLSVLPASAAKRVALVIGNSDYGHIIDLKNPKNDADLMEQTLRDVGFEVVRHNNLDQRGMKQAMLDFGRKLKAGAEASMFYYAGHGIEMSGQNYLVPVDSDIQSQDEADIQNVSVNSFLALMENSGVPLNIVILDACRNNPFRGIRSSGQGGLAPVKAPRGTYVAYATAPGTVAEDGDGANSPFTVALADSIRQKGLTLEAVLKRTRLKVQEATNGSQLPFDSSAITGEFYFVPVVATETSAQPEVPIADPAQAAFLAAGEDADMLGVVADTFKDSVWGALAREKLKKFAKPTAEAPAVESNVPAPAQTETDATPEPQPPVEVIAPKVKPIVKKVETPAVRKIEKPKAVVKAVPKPRVVKQPKPKAVVTIVRKPKPAPAPKVIQAAKLPHCDSGFLSKGSLCRRGSAVCRVAAVSFRRGGGRPIIMGCH